MSEQILNKTKQKMKEIISSFENELIKIRTGRVNPDILSHIIIDYYGIMTSINQIANIFSLDAHHLVIKPYDHSLISIIVGAINKSDLDLSPITEGNLIRLNILPLTEERRKILVKNMLKEAENFKITIRNERRDANEHIKKNKSLTKDDKKYYENEIQKLTDLFSKQIDDCSKIKKKELNFLL